MTIGAALATSIDARGEAARRHMKTQTQDQHNSRSAALSLSLSLSLSLPLSLSPSLSLRWRSALPVSRKEEGGYHKKLLLHEYDYMHTPEASAQTRGAARIQEDDSKDCTMNNELLRLHEYDYTNTPQQTPRAITQT